MKLKAKTYEYDVEKHPRMGLSSGRQIGLIAQDVETLFPEAVREVPVSLPPDPDSVGNKDAEAVPPETPEMIKTINYTELIPVLVNAIQEQQKEIESLKKKIADY